MPDDTSSLRAAALLSLKSKQSQRRGGPAPSSLAQQTDTVSLIYDEPGQTSPVANSSFTGVNKPMDLDEADTDLEDGEISDSNDIQPRPPVESQTTPTERPAPQPIPAKFSSNELKHLPSRPQPAHPVQHVTSPSHDDLYVRPRPSARSTENSESRGSVLQHMDVDQRPGNSRTRLPVPPALTDRMPTPEALAHLRARLSLSNEDIFEAKVVILDILGWGVPSQYLLDCGISALVVVVCLSELKLRIPRDLENLIDQAELIVHDRKGQNASLGPTPRPNLPAPGARHPLPAIPAPQSGASTPPIDLDDIEQQRKQELLARRAALQSMKKSKQSEPPSRYDYGTEVSSEPQANDATMLPVQETEVDAFLADVIVDEEDTNAEDNQHYERMEVEQALVVEEPEEEMSASASNGQASSTHPHPAQSPQPQPPEPQSPVPAASLPAMPQNHDLTGSDIIVDRTLPPSANASHIRPQSNNPNRRNSKRPVAADFVAYAPQDPSTGSMPVSAPTRSFTSDSNSNAALRRRNFGPSVQQRLVIDLSDDEGSDGGGENDRILNGGQSKSATRGPPMIARETSWTAANAAATSRESSAPVDDEKLKLWQQKQKEIELMRERIRQMEERNKKRTANLSTTTLVEPVVAGSGSEPIATDTLAQSGNVSSVQMPSREGAEDAVINTEGVEDRHHKVSKPAARSDHTYFAPPRSLTPFSQKIFFSASGKLGVPLKQRVAGTGLTEEGTAAESESPLDADGKGVSGQTVQLISAGQRVGQDLTEYSTSVQPVSSSSAFRRYVSAFSLYPSLLSSPHPAYLATPIIHPSSPKARSFLDQVQQLDLGPLRRNIADPQRHLCAYEFSDGSCRDPGCPDIHGKDVDPSDEDITLYLAPLLPNFTQEQIIAALAKARTEEPITTHEMGSDPLRRRLADAVRRLMMGNSTHEPPG